MRLFTLTNIYETTSIKSRKMNEAKSLVNKGFIIWLSGKFFSRDTAGSPEWAR